MVKKNRVSIVALVLVCVVALLGCSSGSDNQSEDTTLTGAFIDSPVAGLSYVTSSGLEGKTNAAGEFSYLAGDSITFFLGAIELGRVLGAEKITPFDLAGYELKGENLSLEDFAQDFIEAELSGSGTKFEKGVNMLILLQSLDENNRASDGIEITEAVFLFFSTVITALAFDSETPDFIVTFLAIFLDLVNEGILVRESGDRPIDRDDALEHFLLQL